MSVAATPATLTLRRRQGRLFGILSTYPPTPCGLATFSAALARGLEANGAAVGVVRVADGDDVVRPESAGRAGQRRARLVSWSERNALNQL